MQQQAESHPQLLPWGTSEQEPAASQKQQQSSVETAAIKGASAMGSMAAGVAMGLICPGVDDRGGLCEPVQQSVAGLAASLGKHEHVIARLRQQLNESLTAHQQRLTQELQQIIQATAVQAAAGACAGAAAGAAAGGAAATKWAQAAAAAACRRDGLVRPAALPGSSTATGTASTVAASCAHVADSGSSQQQLIDKHELMQLRAAAAQAQVLQQRLEAAEAKLSIHRAAAVAAKQRIHSLEDLLIQQHQLQVQQLSKAAMDMPQQVTEQQQQQEQPQHHHQQSSLIGAPQTPESGSSANTGCSCNCFDDDYAAPANDGSYCTAVVERNPALQASSSSAAVAPLEQLPQHQGQQQQLDTEPPSWDLMLSPGPSPAELQQIIRLRGLECQASSLQDHLRMAIVDNTVLCYECMHLQHLLVQERLAGRSACQAAALKLAGDVITLRSQLQEAQAELDLGKLACQVAGLGTQQRQQQQEQEVAQQQSWQQIDHQSQQQEAGGCSAAAYVEQCRASVLRTVEDHMAQNQVRGGIEWEETPLLLVCMCCLSYHHSSNTLVSCFYLAPDLLCTQMLVAADRRDLVRLCVANCPGPALRLCCATWTVACRPSAAGMTTPPGQTTSSSSWQPLSKHLLLLASSSQCRRGCSTSYSQRKAAASCCE